ncbi:asparagine synthase (glutamine-hydrolyzing) [Luteibacter sp. CQ10]|uniref:asparagine synthase (glutamine-hydrolyzing) n=1 Tax=Luteibacter sp. CQ10 TaxID=2805821 RepID=UPI0034A395E3
MCGIAGLIDPSGFGTDTVERMLNRLRHRGPDGEGILALPGGVTLGHRRLAILGRGETGSQPMRYGPWVVTYNGEIYNHLKLRSSLLKERNDLPAWRGASDTETLLAAISTWGLETTLKKIDGMFAFALWNDDERSLTLVRDRMGEKPLYFGWIEGRFAFASELTAFAPIPGWHPTLNEMATDTFLRHGFVAGEQSLVNGVYRLPPGAFMRLSEAQFRQSSPHPPLSRMQRRYWSLEDVAAVGLRSPIKASDASDELESLLLRSVADRTLAEVPVGAFLSGGVDSSLVAALMQASSHNRVHTFSIGFDDTKLDESIHARAVAKHLGTEHTEFRATAADALEIASTLPSLLDEPIADASQLPTMLLARLASKKVTVALSGDGADELFAGYGRYGAIVGTWKRVVKWHPMARRGLTTVARVTSQRSGVVGRFSRWTARAAAPSLEQMRMAFIGGGNHAHLGWRDQRTNVTKGGLSPIRRIMLADQSDFLPDDILQKVDRATMRFGLESRSPFLDHRVVAFSWRLQDAALPLHFPQKPILRQLLRKYVPDHLMDRPKQGFDPPMRDWLRGPLAPWVDNALEKKRLEAIGNIDVRQVHDMWHSHRNGRIDATRELWPIAMLSMWSAANGISR